MLGPADKCKYTNHNFNQTEDYCVLWPVCIYGLTVLGKSNWGHAHIFFGDQGSQIKSLLCKEWMGNHGPKNLIKHVVMTQAPDRMLTLWEWK